MAGRAAIEDALKRLAPGIPRHEAASIVDDAMDNPRLRRAAPEEAAWP
ncbi:hypothetical protein [Geminicoccus roseus]|nr:hypothetical protein [Geminicoccus roseus]